MKNKFDFYEVVEIKSSLKKHAKINSHFGVVMAMSQNYDGTWGYAVDVYLADFGDHDNTEDRDLNEKYLQPTGKFMKREDFYDGSVAKVVVDEEGRGHLKELHLKDDKPSTKGS